MPERRIFLALPSYGGVNSQVSLAVADALRGRGIFARANCGSLLARCFNELWAEALNTRGAMRWTHFVMLHADIAPDQGWLPKLLDEMDRVGADVLSAVSPIKDHTRTTSTALLEGNEVVKLDEATLERLPATFDGRHFPGKTLLVNTGLLAVRFDDPAGWVERCWFEIRDSIEFNARNGRYEVRGMSEDWHFSQLCHALGRRVFATQAIGLKHYGEAAWQRDARPVDAAAGPLSEDCERGNRQQALGIRDEGSLPLPTA